MKKLFLDTETTGLSRYRNRICSLTLVDEYDNARTFMFNPEQPVEPGASRVNGYTWALLRKYPTFASQARQIKLILDSADVVIAHNAAFDVGFLKSEFDRCGLCWNPRCVECTMQKAKRKFGNSCSCYSLDYLTRFLGLQNLRGTFHGSTEDACMCKALYYKLDAQPTIQPWALKALMDQAQPKRQPHVFLVPKSTKRMQSVSDTPKKPIKQNSQTYTNCHSYTNSSNYYDDTLPLRIFGWVSLMVFLLALTAL